MHELNKGRFSVRLIVLFLILKPIYSWSFFGHGESDKIALHPLSPSEADPKTLRLKRQAYQVNIDGDVTVTVDQSGGGTIETGSWGPWHREGECSRPCDGGVYKEKRECNGECTGASIRYQSCNLEECPEDSPDFRGEQCKSHNDKPLDGKYYKWVPYAGANKCELTCKPDSADFYYKWADKVVDGTKCDKLSNDICVDGVCLPLGCDGKLGSTSKADKCGVCNGNGTTCKSQEGVIKENALTAGYNNIIVLPVGATSIKIEENRPTSNSLAIKNDTSYYLNGNHQIVLSNQDVTAGGTVFKYQKAKADSSLSERLTAAGPLKEELTIQLLFQRAPHGSAVKYSFSTPLEEDVQFIYKPGEWSQCSVQCGKGVQTRSVFCTDTKTQQRVGDEICDENNSTKPELEKPCLTVDCDAEWFVGNWEDCSDSCGNHGWQYRVVYCHKVFANGKRMTVDDDNCTNTERPPVKQTCNRFSCPEWNLGPWSACSQKCGDAKQYRSVTCRSQKEGEEAKLLPASDCPPNQELEQERHCNLGPCDGLTFSTTDWDLCERCNDTEETRNVTCKDETGRLYPLEKCLTKKITEIPSFTRACATQPPCVYEWHVSEWSKCSTECGHGHKTRKVHCAINELGDIKILDESLCNDKKPESKENCTNEEKCTGTYYSGPWSNCTAECGGGTQTRVIVCLNYDKKPVPEWCDELERPSEQQECNVDPCPTIELFMGNETESLDADNSTMSTKEGEDEMAGSGEEPTEATKGEECEVTNEETGEIAKLPCSEVNKTEDAIEALLLLGNNETEGDNQTKSCAKTEFGCCSDWFTPAEGKNYEGCPEFVLGECANSTFGCCQDNVTLARGPDLQGCGNPECAASLFGCCQDRKTIAFGPRYKGCERSTFNCETSEFGCCPDGTTAALGKNGTGCGSDCLLTKWGCCGDGITTAKGPNSEGCPCRFQAFGCCSDGKTAAKGPSFYGCPDSCAQSRFGCCPDGKTASQGPNKEGCGCQYTRWGCCKDGESSAIGPNQQGCDDCHRSKYGCCHDGSKASGPNLQGCPSTTPAAFIIGGTVAPERIVACNLPQDKGSVGQGGYQLSWFYDTAEARCSQFWYGGMDGNANRFHSKEECEAICVEPPQKGRCYLPKIEGPIRCSNLVARYWYDYTTKQCAAFWWRGCLGNSNNFNSWEECTTECKGVGPFEESEPAIVTITPFFPSESRRTEPVNQPQESSQGWSSANEETERRLKLQKQHEEARRLHEQLHENQMRVDEAHRNQLEQQRVEEQRRAEAQARENQLEQQRRAEAQARENQLEQQRIEEQRRLGQSIQSPSRNEIESVCKLGVDAGTCGDYQDAYYFDYFTRQCYPFIYSGCGGNKNRFDSLAKCEQYCHILVNQPLGQSPHITVTEKPNLATTRKSADVCNLAKDVGRCTGQFNRYYYDRDTGTCELFKYSGCGGNHNRFNSREECSQVCLRSASQPQVPSLSQELGQSASSQTGSNERCEGEKDHGPCSNFALKWWYNKEDGTCTKFYWGGCGGNANMHETEQDCKNSCGNYVDACGLPAVKGPCEGKRQRFYYNKDKRECEEFVFGGCLGNSNNYESLEECQQRCGSHKKDLNEADSPQRRIARFHSTENTIESNLVEMTQTRDEVYGRPLQMISIETTTTEQPEEITIHPQTKTSLPELCLLPEDAGNCHGSMLRYRYDSENNQCVSFNWTGCNGNNNLFASNEACERACGKFRLQDVCNQGPEPGNCNLKVPKWYYDRDTLTCKIFMWSGCGTGNGNSFTSSEECNNLCNAESQVDKNADICFLKRDSGPCQDGTTMWYFEAETGECRRFTYGGCRGNGNRFSSKDECLHRCSSRITPKIVQKEPKEICSLPFEAGSCSGIEKKWFFDVGTGRCRSFTYSGCEGNENRYDDEISCFNACKQFAKTSHLEHRQRPFVIASQNGVYTAGSTIELRCIYEAANVDVIWYRNDTKLKSENVDRRYTSIGQLLRITNSKPEDGGDYACVPGQLSILSQPLKVSIKAIPYDTCSDKGTESTCSLIKRTNLCSNVRYARFCCQTCSAASI